MAYLHPEDIESFLTEARVHIESEVRLGFAAPEAIVERVMALAGVDDYAEELKEQLTAIRSRVEQMVATTVARDEDAQAGWPEVTDCDRLDAAFTTLREDGLLAAQRFGPSPEMGWQQVSEYIAELPEEARPWGFVFLDDESIWESFDGATLRVNFGAVGDDFHLAQRVAALALERLREVGLDAVWHHRPDGRLMVRGFHWQRRRPNSS